MCRQNFSQNCHRHYCTVHLHNSQFLIQNFTNNQNTKISFKNPKIKMHKTSYNFKKVNFLKKKIPKILEDWDIYVGTKRRHVRWKLYRYGYTSADNRRDTTEPKFTFTVHSFYETPTLTVVGALLGGEKALNVCV